jgi:hypothetical protein
MSACAAAAAPVCPACSEFDARPVDSEVQTQPLLQEPRTVTAHYAAGEAEEGDGKVILIIICYLIFTLFVLSFK